MSKDRSIFKWKRGIKINDYSDNRTKMRKRNKISFFFSFIRNQNVINVKVTEYKNYLEIGLFKKKKKWTCLKREKQN